MLRRVPISRRALLAGGSAMCVAATARPTSRSADWRALGDDVREQMRWAWGHYRERAWGKDQIKPLSGGFESFPLKDHHLGLTLIEALDTLWVMELDADRRITVDPENISASYLDAFPRWPLPALACQSNNSNSPASSSRKRSRVSSRPAA